MDRVLALAAQNHGVVTLAEARDLGVTRQTLRTAIAKGILRRVAPTVFVAAGSPATSDQTLLAATRAAGRGAGLARGSAWRRQGFRTNVDPGLLVIAPAGTNGAGVVALGGRLVHSDYLPPHHLRLVDGIPVTTPARTVLDLCGRPPFVRWPHRARRLVEDALNGGVAHADLSLVVAECGASGRNGCGVLRSVLDELDPSYVATESELEDMVVAVLRAAGLPEPRRQALIGGTSAPIGRFDFWYPEARLVIEADSQAHHGGWVQQERDRQRDLRLAALGIVVLRPTWRLLIDRPQEFVAAVGARLAQSDALHPSFSS